MTRVFSYGLHRECFITNIYNKHKIYYGIQKKYIYLSLYITRSLLRPKIHSDKITKGSTSRKDLLLTVHAAAFGPPSAA